MNREPTPVVPPEQIVWTNWRGEPVDPPPPQKPFSNCTAADGKSAVASGDEHRMAFADWSKNRYGWVSQLVEDIHSIAAEEVFYTASTLMLAGLYFLAPGQRYAFRRKTWWESGRLQ